ncbi:MAG: hypothetical protein VYB71_02910 [Chloroflexota bacterium]|nr:hypothetical protein [Chloroflexota bacterium]
MTIGIMFAEGIQERMPQRLMMGLYSATLDSTSSTLSIPTRNVDGATYYIRWKWALAQPLIAEAEIVRSVASWRSEVT